MAYISFIYFPFRSGENELRVGLRWPKREGGGGGERERKKEKKRRKKKKKEKKKARARAIVAGLFSIECIKHDTKISVVVQNGMVVVH